MSVLFLTEYNTSCYGVTFETNGCIKVQKYKKIFKYEKNLLYIKFLKII